MRAHLAEQGIVAPVGPAHVGRLAAFVDGDDGALPSAVRYLARSLLDQIAGLSEKAADLDAELRRRESTDDGDLLEGARLRSLGWSYAETAFEGRQRAPWPDIKDGPA
nr:hypothetical protein [Roseobacter litoralis]